MVRPNNKSEKVEDMLTLCSWKFFLIHIDSPHILCIWKNDEKVLSILNNTFEEMVRKSNKSEESREISNKVK